MTTASEREQQIDEWAARLEQRQRAYRELAADMTTVSATGESPRGIVRVTTDHAGLVTDIQIRDGHRHVTGHELATEIMTAMRRAQASVQEQVLDLVHEHMPDDQEAAESVAEQYRRRFAAERAPTRTATRPESDDEGFGSVFED